MVTTEEPRRAEGATTTVDLRAVGVCLAAVTPARADTVKPATAAMAPRMRFGIWGDRNISQWTGPNFDISAPRI